MKAEEANIPFQCFCLAARRKIADWRYLWTGASQLDHLHGQY